MPIVSLSGDNSHELEEIRSLADAGKIKMVRVPAYTGRKAHSFDELLSDGRVRFSNQCYISFTECEFIID